MPYVVGKKLGPFRNISWAKSAKRVSEEINPLLRAAVKITIPEKKISSESRPKSENRLEGLIITIVNSCTDLAANPSFTPGNLFRDDST